MNSRLEKIINKVAKDRGIEPDLVMDVIDTLFRNMAATMNDYRYPEIRIPNFGALRARPTYVEDEIAKLMEKMRTHTVPESLYGKIVVLNKTCKRLRHEKRFRKRNSNYRKMKQNG